MAKLNAFITTMILLALLTRVLLSSAVDVCSNQNTEGNFQMRFPDTAVTDFATWGGFNENLTALTISFWMKTLSSGPICILSYATLDNDDEIRVCFRDDKKFKVQIGNNNMPNIGPVTVNDGRWRHVAVTWSNTDGNKSLYIDGFLQGTVTADIGHVVPTNGSFVIGQRQELGAGFPPKYSFSGYLNNMNIWNDRFDHVTIANLVQYCGCGRGNVVAWPDLKGNTHGNVAVEAANCQILGKGQDCLDLVQKGHVTTGVYVVDPDNEGFFPVLCDQETNGGGWFVFQKRFNGSVDFYRTWEEYALGFGSLGGEFWLGNYQIHRLSASTQSRLLVELEDVAKDRGYAYYPKFSVGSPAESFVLFLGGYSGTVSNTFKYHSGAEFSTHDRDNDDQDYNMAEKYEEAWWFGRVLQVHLNGRYYPDGVPKSPYHGLRWRSWKNANEQYNSLTMSTMKSRPSRELSSDYSLLFGSGEPSANVSLPRITGWKQSTVAWWMKVQRTSAVWRSVFSLENSEFNRAMAFHIESSARMFINNEMIAINSSVAFDDDLWHHMCITWDNSNGQWKFLIDGAVKKSGSGVQMNSLVQEGRLIIGNGQGAQEGFIGELSHFNMWDYLLPDLDITDMVVKCHAVVGNLVPWPQVKFWINGKVEVKKFVRCYNREAHRWSFTEQENNLVPDVYSAVEANISSDGADTDLKLLSAFGQGIVTFPAPAEHCVISPKLCSNGLSVDFWLRYPAHFAQSHILGGNQKYLSTLNDWLSPFMTPNAKWLRCYRATQDGWAGSDFHGNCDRKGPTVTLVKVRDNVFGGFMDQNWGGNNRNLYSISAFLFSLQNERGTSPVKLKVVQNDIAGRDFVDYGPYFGYGDLRIYVPHGPRSPTSSSNLGASYELPTSSMAAGSTEARSFFAGTPNYPIDEVEVFYYHVNHQAIGVNDRLKVVDDQITEISNTYQDQTDSAKQSQWDTEDSTWCPYYASREEWLEIAFSAPTYIKHFRITGKQDEEVKKVNWRYHDGTSWHWKFDVSIATDNKQKKYDVKKNCKYFRIYPKEWKNWPCLRLQLLKTGSEVISYPDSDISASSYRCMTPPRFARLGFGTTCHSSWCTQNTGPTSWLEIDMGKKLFVAYVATEGSHKDNIKYFMKSYWLLYSLNGEDYEVYQENGRNKLFLGNWVGGGSVKNAILPPFYAQFVRFQRHSCANHLCCLRVEIYSLIEEQQFNMLTSRGVDTNNAGMAFFHKYDISSNHSSYHVQVATDTEVWALQLSSLPSAWFHVAITWRNTWGLKFFQDGRLRAATNKVQKLSGAAYSNELSIAMPSTYLDKFHQGLQLSSLGIWTSHLPEEQIPSIVNLAGPYEDGLMLSNVEQDGDQFDWQMLSPECKNGICTNTSDCSQPLGMENGSIPDSKITASTEVNAAHGTSNARLNFQRGGGKTGAWSAGVKDTNQWLQVEFARPRKINFIQTQGRQDWDQWVTSYAVSYSLDNKNFKPYQRNGEEVVFDGNTDRDSIVTQIVVSPPIVARYIRIHPRSWSGHISMRVEFLGCNLELFDCKRFGPLGMESKQIPSSAFKASSTLYGSNSLYGRLRSYMFWIPKLQNTEQWLQVCFMHAVRLSGVQNQGRHNYNQWVKSYTVSVSLNKEDFEVIRENGQAKEFQGNTDKNTVITNVISPAIVALCVRVHPKSWRSYIAMRLEFLGCRSGAKYIDASYPRAKGDTARLQSIHLLQTHKCLQFSYHMGGHNTGRLNVYKQSYDGEEALIWRLAGKQGEGWNPAEIPLNEHLPYKLIFEGVVGDGYDGDIGIKISSLSVETNCTFVPEKARRRLSGILSQMISHIAGYQDQLNAWLSEAGHWGGGYWSPCFRAIEHGWDIEHYYKHCTGPSVVIIRKGSYVFGGFSSVAWERIDSATEPAPASFLFSLKNAINETFDGTKWELKDNKLHHAIKNEQAYLTFGHFDIRVQLSNGKLTFLFGSQSFKAPDIANPKLLFAGQDSFFADDMEVLMFGDGTLCDPLCLPGQVCDEILGKCVCDQSARDVGLCKLRADLQMKRDELCNPNGTASTTYYARYEHNNKNKSEKAWRCFAEEALTGDRLRYDTRKSADAFYNNSLLSGMLEKSNYSLLLLDKLTEESVFYWSMDNRYDVKNLRGLSWASLPSGKVSAVRGVRNKALHVDGTAGVATLEDWDKSGSCAFAPLNCTLGFTLSLWLKFENKDPLAEQVFISTGQKNQSGFKVFQPLRSPEQISFQVTSKTKRCNVTFPATTSTWMHYVFSWSGVALGNDITAYVNGEMIANESVCSEGVFTATSEGLITVGENELLPLAEFDEILMWYKTFSGEEIRRVFQYYEEGGVSLEVHISLSLLYKTWNSSLLDKETATFQKLSRDIGRQVEILSLPTKPSSIQIQKFWNATGIFGVEVLVAYEDLGFEQFEPLYKNLSGNKMVEVLSFVPNNVYVNPIKLHPGSFVNETTVSIAVNWIHDSELSHGIFQGYEFYYYEVEGNLTGNFTIKGNKSEHLISNLTAFTLYNVSARVLTLEGSSGWSPVLSVRTAEAAPVAAPSDFMGFNTSSRSLNISWSPLPSELVPGIVRGYVVTYWVSGYENKTKQNRMLGAELSAILEQLERFSLYALQIAAYTLPSEIGPFSDVIYIKTSEDAPSAPPQNITAHNTSSNSVMLEWAPVPVEQRHGITRGYRIQCRNSSSSFPVQTMEVGASVLKAELKNLSSFELYTCCVQAVTVGIGPCGVRMFLTQEGVPAVPPVIVSAYNTSSTSVHIKWSAVSNDSVPGYLLGYLVRYKLVADIKYLLQTSCTAHLEANLTGLNKYTTYNVSVTAFTSVGHGPYSRTVDVTTDEDIPESVPQNISTPQAKPDAITLAWTPPDKSNGLILGYRIILFDTMRNKTHKITVNSSVANLDGLFPYTDYKAKIIPFTSKGEGNASDFINVKTQEAAPSKPPRNVTANNSSSTEIKINWKPVDKLFVNGKMRFYVIYYFETFSTDKIVYNLSVPVEQESRRRRAVAVDPPTFQLQGLKKYTTYTIQLAAFTVDVGVRSPLMNVTTSEDVPSLPPVNVTTYNTSSTSIHVQWRPVQSDGLNGILRGYKVLYRRANQPNTNFQVTPTNPSTLNTELTNLGKFKLYDISVLAITVGDGNQSTPVQQRTDQDIPDSAPLNFTASPLNTTAIKMNWQHVLEEEQNGIILGYKVKLYNTSGNNVRNVTMLGSNTRSLIIGGLEIWTNYTSKLYAFTIKGNGPWSSLICRTDEEAPRFPPTNVTAYNTSSTTLHVAWQPVDPSRIRGILRGYRVFYFPEDTVHLKTLKNISVGPSTLQADLDSLYKYTNYSISVAAFTIADGVPSEKIFTRTHEDRPDKPPTNVKFKYPSSSSLLVDWEEVPLGYRNGIIRSYTVQYVQTDRASPAITVDVGADTFSLNIPGLKKFHNYIVRIWANTSIGSGPPSEPAVMTDQDVPNIPPPNITAENFVTTHTIPLAWIHIPFLEVNGILLGYRIRYKIINMGQYPYEDENPQKIDVAAQDTSVVLQNLESFAVYRIEITGFTIKGEGPPGVIIAETCRCVKRLTTNWVKFLPYVDKKSSGLIPPVFNDMVVECCRTCKSHGKSWVDFDWDGNGKPALKTDASEFKQITHKTDFHFPLYGYKLQDKYQHEFGYIGLIESPGIAYIVNTDSGDEISNAVFREIFGTWPLILLCLLFAYIAGVLLWVTERSSEEAKFPKSFFNGAAEGLWWAYVTMTTVGYGDRTAMTILGRIVGISWTLIGLVINGILVSALASALTSVSSVGGYQLYGSKVAALHGSPEYNLAIRKNAVLDKTHKYKDYSEVYDRLVAHDIEGALIDAYTVGSQKELFEKPFLRIIKVYDYSATYGAAMGGDSRKLQKCFDDYIPMNIAKIFKHIEGIVDAIEEPAAPLASERSANLFDSQSQLFQKTLLVTGAMLGVSLLLGLAYEFLYRSKSGAKVGAQVKDVDVRKEQTNELREMLEEFQEHFQTVNTELREEHCRQRESWMSRHGSQKKLWYMTLTGRSSRVSDVGVNKPDLELMQRASEASFVEKDSPAEKEVFNPRSTLTLTECQQSEADPREEDKCTENATEA